MTGKERIITALKGGKPDMVPVSVGVSESWPVRLAGGDYIELFWYQKASLMELRIACEKYFGGDFFLHGTLGASPEDPPNEEFVLCDEPDRKIVQVNIHTSSGILTKELLYQRNHPISVLKAPIEDPPSQWRASLALLTDPASRSDEEYRKGYLFTGDAGMFGYWINSPMDWWASLRGQPDKVLFDLYDYPQLIKDIFKEYTQYCICELKEVASRLVIDSLGIGSAVAGISVCSPSIFQQWTVPFIDILSKTAHELGFPVQIHMCGRSREALDILAETPLDAVEPLERPPTGDVNLREVKETFSGKFSLKGNVHTIETLLRGTVDNVQREALSCLEAAMEGGGFILAPGDQPPYETPEDNLFALVEVARQYGRY